jgi:protein ImuA
MHYLANTRTRHHCRPDQGQPRSAEGPSPLAKAPFGLTDAPVGRPVMVHRGRTTGQGENVACQSARDPEAQGQTLDLTGGSRIAKLRQTIAKLETSFFRATPTTLSLGVPEIHRHLPGPGLACGVLHEVSAASYGDEPAALAFLLALASLALQAKPGLVIVVLSQWACAEWGRPYGHGLDRLGVDPSRLMLVEAHTDKEALWSLEEILRSRAQPAMVAGALASRPDLTASRRLNLAAAALAIPLALAFHAKARGESAAATRWRIGTIPASRDRFGALLNPRWSVSLERCRQGRPGTWFVEWNHVAHRFSLVEGMADRSSTQGAGLRVAG